MTLGRVYLVFALLSTGFAKDAETNRISDSPEAAEEGEASLLASRQIVGRVDLAAEDVDEFEADSALGMQKATCDSSCAETTESGWTMCTWSKCHGCQKCVNNGCTAPTNIENAHPDGVCENGPFIPYANACKVRCRDGQYPVKSKVTCNGAFKDPLACRPKNCKTSYVSNQASSTICTSGSSSITHGSSCTMACKDGWEPSTPSLSCFEGQISPQTYTCDPKGCSPPLSVENSVSPVCAESTIEHGESCHPKCNPGYLPNLTAASCSRGDLKPFKCVEMWPTYGTGFCQNPVKKNFQHYKIFADDCKAKCESYTWCSFYTFSLTAPNKERCVLFERCRGVMPSYNGTSYAGHTVFKKTNVQDCVAPKKASVSFGASLSCDGQPVEFNSDATIYWKATCQALCAEGYEPSETALHCLDGGVLSPPSFTCSGKSCSIKKTSYEAEGGVCNGGRSLSHDSKCSMICKPGYTASVDTLSCFGGVVTPSTYSCSPTSCSAPSVAFSSASSCAEGATIAHGSRCTPACLEGYFADVISTKCEYGELKNFTCVKHWPILGSGGCSSSRTQWMVWRNDPDSCQRYCESKGWCHFFSFNTAAPYQQRCLIHGTCDERTTSFNGTDLTDFTLYQAAYAQDCVVPALLSSDPSSGDKLDCSGQIVEFGSGQPIKYAEECQMKCAAGYTATAASLRCTSGGQLDPPSIMCEPTKCSNIEGGRILNALNQRCKEGLPVNSGSDCTPNCAEGFTSTQTSLKCLKGVFDPVRYECFESPCTVGDVVNAPPEGVCNGTKEHYEKCFPKCAEGYWATQYQMDCRFGKYKQGEVSCESEPTWWVEEWNCRTNCTRSSCRYDCTRKWAPPPVRLQEDDCSIQCKLDELLGNALPSFCSRCTREEAVRLYDLGALDFPSWRIEFYNCYYAETYTGFHPSIRTGLPGCYWLSGSAVQNCERECVVGQPMEVRTQMLNCEEDCLLADYTGLSDKNVTTAKGYCMDMCPKKVVEKMKLEEEARKLLGDGGGGDDTVSSEALQNLAQKVLELDTKMVKLNVDATNDAQQALTGLMHAQLSTDEAVRQAGSSGVTKVRIYKGGSRPYLEATHTTSGPQSAHNHANHANTVGLGELAAVMNGVSFRTRHNDYSLVMPGKAPMKYHATEPLPRPDVPPSVLQAGSVEEQIKELRLYFKAFNEQNVSLRDFRPYFTPVLCYLEGAWEKLEGDDLVEPFVSDRHHIAATGWKDLLEKVRFFDYSGGKDTLENIPWLPTTVLDMSIIDGRLVPKLAKWSYRILCHPVDGDVELVRLVPQFRDWATYKQSRSSSWAKYSESRRARYTVHPVLSLNSVEKNPFNEVQSTRNYLDLLMEQIPGKDGYGANLTDEIMNPKTFRLEPYGEESPSRAKHGTSINSQHVAGSLNVAYYSRYFSGGKDAMGRAEYRRGYNDGNLWAAMTTQQEVASMSMINSGSSIKPGEICVMEDGTACPKIAQSWTYALPVEIIYLNPLMTWNPYNIAFKHEPDGGDGTEGNPYTNAGRRDSYFHTPTDFFGSGCADPATVDAADTSAGAKYVYGGDGVARTVQASGVNIHTACIEGVGRVRQRYNIMPLNADGNTAYKEVQALGAMVLDGQIPEGEPEPEGTGGGGGGVLELALTAANDGHQHELIFGSDEIETLRNGTGVWVVSSFVEGHTHQVKVDATTNTDDVSSHDWVYNMKECLTGGTSGPMPPACVDGHQALLFEFESS